MPSPPTDGRSRNNARPEILGQIPKKAICAEVGTWKGNFAALIFKTARPAELHLVDPWKFDADFPERWYGGAEAKSQVDMDAICEGVRSRFSGRPQIKIHRFPSVEGSRQFKDAYFDWVYIDGDHSYAAVRDDLAAWYPKVKPGGQLVCDDYDWRDEAGQLSVQQAVDEFVAARQAKGSRQPSGQFIIYPE